jgi:hypothetical protein
LFASEPFAVFPSGKNVRGRFLALLADLTQGCIVRFRLGGSQEFLKASGAQFRHSSRSHNAVICVYDNAGNVIETHERKGDFKEW